MKTRLIHRRRIESWVMGLRVIKVRRRLGRELMMMTMMMLRWMVWGLMNTTR